MWIRSYCVTLEYLSDFAEIIGEYKTMIDFEWITIDAGEFEMGSDLLEAHRLSEHYKSKVFLQELPRRTVYVPAFQISKYPITNAQFKVFADETKHQSAYILSFFHSESRLNHPVRFLSLMDTLAFCSWANCRLPTEVEWEKAAAGNLGLTYPWGNIWDPTKCNNRESYSSTSASSTFSSIDTTPVDQYPAGESPYGVMGMAGNVWELTATTLITNLHSEVCRADFNGEDQPAKTDFVSDQYREWPILKGGAAYTNRLGIRNSFRKTKYGPHEVGDFVGFRCIKLP